jgi:2-methylcitrate dehydratase PrpD
MSMAVEIAEWVSRVKFDDLPPDVVEVTRRSHLDTIGVVLAGLQEPVTQAVYGFLAEEGSRPVATQLGTRFKTSMSGAALINGASGHALDYDDVNLNCLGHPSAVIVPAILAVAEATGANGRAVTEAYAVGVDIMAKLGLTVGLGHYSTGWHATSTLGTLGAAMAAGKLLGLTRNQLVNALAAAVSMAGGSRRNFGTMIKPFHPGHAARCGIEAARLAKHGLVGDSEIMEAPYGFFSLFTRDGVDIAGLTKRLGNPFDLVSPGINVKRYPCCYNTHRAADATLTIAKQVKAAEVESVRVAVPVGGMLPLIHPRPQAGLEGKFSMQYVVAAGLLDQAITLSTFSDEAVRRPVAQDLLKRVTVVEDPAIGPLTNPVEEGYVQVAVRTRQGQELVQRVKHPIGAPQDPLSWDDLVRKFTDCVRGVIDQRQTERAVASIRALDRQRNMSEIVGAVTPA